MLTDGPSPQHDKNLIWLCLTSGLLWPRCRGTEPSIPNAWLWSVVPTVVSCPATWLVSTQTSTERVQPGIRSLMPQRYWEPATLWTGEEHCPYYSQQHHKAVKKYSHLLDFFIFDDVTNFMFLYDGQKHKAGHSWKKKNETSCTFLLHVFL